MLDLHEDHSRIVRPFQKGNKGFDGSCCASDIGGHCVHDEFRDWRARFVFVRGDASLGWSVSALEWVHGRNKKKVMS